MIALAIPAVLLALVLHALLEGWAISVMWGWFIVPLFHLPPLTIPAAIGLGLVTGALTMQYIPQKDDDWSGPLVHALIGPLLTLGVGWILHAGWPL